MPDEKCHKPVAQFTLNFRARSELAHVDDPIQRDISALVIAGRTLFAACDETASVERLILDDAAGDRFGDHRNFALGEVFDLPDGPDGEMDIESLAIDDGWLWVCGSHSLKRDTDDAEAVSAFDTIEWDPNRAFLGRLPLLDRGDGIVEPVGAIEPVDSPQRIARSVAFSGERGYLRKLLAGDPVLGPFLDIPCKENGFDIEGMAVHDNKVWLGLRGPVIGGYAIIIELAVKERRSKSRRLKPRKRNGKRYRLFALDLDGQAIRDLDWHDGALYILSGATTDLEAMQSVYRVFHWPTDDEIVSADALERVIDLPTIRGSDHAEGLCIVERNDSLQAVVAYDSPREDRVDDASQTIDVDLFNL